MEKFRLTMTRSPDDRHRGGPVYWSGEDWIKEDGKAMLFDSADSARIELEHNVEVWGPVFDEVGWIDLPIRDDQLDDYVDIEAVP